MTAKVYRWDYWSHFIIPLNFLCIFVIPVILYPLYDYRIAQMNEILSFLLKQLLSCQYKKVWLMATV